MSRFFLKIVECRYGALVLSVYTVALILQTQIDPIAYTVDNDCYFFELMVLHGLLALQKRYSFVRKVVESFVTLYFILDLCPQPLATVWKANGETFMQDSLFLIVALLAIVNMKNVGTLQQLGSE